MKQAPGPVLITGAAGFIGSFVAARLARMGSPVFACDNFNDYYSPQLKIDRVSALLTPHGLSCERVELADPAQVERLFDKARPSCVVHLAAQAGVRHSLENPAAYVRSNLVAFSNILEACRRWKPRHLVYASSSSVYGANRKVPFHEDDPTDTPLSLYAATKKSNEVMAHSYSHLFGLPATGLRFFTVYGPWGRPDMAYFHFAQKMLKGEPVPVYGEGKLSRDFTYISDIVEGVVRVLMNPKEATPDAPPHAILNIGNHQPVQLIDFISILERELGVAAKLQFLPMPPGDMAATYADTRRLQALTGFAPATSLEVGLAHFCKWFIGWNEQQAKLAPAAPERADDEAPSFFIREENIMIQQQFESCIEACNACALACDNCASACLQEADVKKMADCIALDIDCAQICRLAAGFMGRGSPLAATVCQACAEVCDACGDECAKYPMQHCQDCAQACRRCAGECRRMAGMGTGTQAGRGTAVEVH